MIKRLRTKYELKQLDVPKKSNKKTQMAWSLCYMEFLCWRLVTANNSTNMQLEGELERQQCIFCSARDWKNMRIQGSILRK